MYDWANSAYSLVITSTIFPIYYGSITGDAPTVRLLGWEGNGSALFSYAVSFSFLLTALLSPLLTAVADYGGLKKRFMQTFAYMGSISCVLLYFFTGLDTLVLGIIAFVFAGVGYNGSLVFYNAYLPEIATPDRYDRISARGFSLGYIGSVLLLIFNLAMVMKPTWFGIDPENGGLAARLSFVSVGLWWVGFSQITFRRLPHNVYRRPSGHNWLLNGFRTLQRVFREARQIPALRRYLPAFFFYNMGVQTVMYLATLFGDQELNLPAESLIVTILLLQLLAIVGAWGFARLSERFGNVSTLAAMVVVWVGICGGAYFVQTAEHFYALAAVVGLVMGGIQALSRATYAKLIPAGAHEHASYFSFFDVMEKVSIVLGTLAFGVVVDLTGSMRNSILFLALFFVVGLVLLLSMKHLRPRQSLVASAGKA